MVCTDNVQGIPCIGHIEHNIYIFDLQRGLDHNYISDYNIVKSLYAEMVTSGGPGAGSG